MKYIRTYEHREYNKNGDKYDIGDIVICVETYNNQIVLNRKYKVLDIKGGDIFAHYEYHIDVEDMETGKIFSGCFADRFKLQREIDTIKYNL